MSTSGSFRWQYVILVTGVAALLACGPVAEECNSLNCSGCCDEKGICQTGSTPNQCGFSGGACMACAADQLCTGGVCIQYGVGGKKDGGSNDGDAGDDAGTDGGSDAGVDGGSDGGFDGGTDGGFDGGTDGGFDAGFDGGFDGGSDAGCKVNGSSCTSAGQCCSEYCSNTGVCGTPPPVDSGPWVGESCSNPEALSFSPWGSGLRSTTTASTVGYNQDGTTASCGGFGPDRVFAFTTTATWDAEITLTSPSGAPMAYEIRGPNCTTALICAAAGQADSYPQVPAGTWYVWVDTDQTAGAPFALTVTLTPPSYAGDTCTSPSNQTFVNDTFTVSGDTTGYANDLSTTASGCSSATGGDVFYTFYNPGLADLSATISTPSSSYRPAVYFLSGACPAAASGTCGVAASGGQTATATLNAAPSGTYYLVVDGAVSTNGLYNVVVNRTPVSSATGESCSSPIPLSFSGTTTLTASATGSTTGATNDKTNTCEASGSGAPDRVYTFTLNTTKSFSATVTPSPSWDVGLSLFSGSCTAGTEITCADVDPYAPETISASSLSPGTYYLWVDGYYSSSSGSYSLSVTLQ